MSSHPFAATLVNQQRNWIAQCGGTLAGYTANYGMIGAEVFASDMRELRRYEHALATSIRHPVGMFMLLPLAIVGLAYLLVHWLSRALFLAVVGLARLANHLGTPEPQRAIRSRAVRQRSQTPQAASEPTDGVYRLAQRISSSDAPDAQSLSIAKKLLPIYEATRAQRAQT